MKFQTIGRTLGNVRKNPNGRSFHHQDQNGQRLLSKPALKVVSINIEGLSSDKEVLLSNICKQTACDFLLIQETHRGTTDRRPKVTGMNLIIERPSVTYGSAVFAKSGVNTISADSTSDNDIEILTVEIQSCTVTSIYKPPNTNFCFKEPSNFHSQPTKIVMGDFNCHSIAWGYKETDKNGEELENWSEQKGLVLIHDPKLPPSFNSGRWRTGYNPDNIFISEHLAHQAKKELAEPIPRTQHRPIICSIEAVVKPQTVHFKRQFNFKKAQWENFTRELDTEILKIDPSPEKYDEFVKIVQAISRKYIPRGCRTNYIPGLDEDSKCIMERYEQLFDTDPFSEETIQTGEDLLHAVSTSRRKKWCDLVSQVDMKQNSRKAWTLLKNLNNDPTTAAPDFSKITPDQIAHQLLMNGKTTGRSEYCKLLRHPDENNYLGTSFTLEELDSVFKSMKNNKAAGLDDIRTEQIKMFGPTTRQWILNLINSCIAKLQIPKIWRRAKVVALLKPGKEPSDPKNFRPVSLLCHLYKVLERLILNRISEHVDEKLLNEQSGFRPGRSCCGQILNLAQHIEDGYERRQVTGVAFIDLTAAYDTVNHRKLVRKVYSITKDYRLTQFIQCLLQNRRFFVTLQNKKSRWRIQKNGLPQGSVLSPLLYNIYTNDQPISLGTRAFIYADDTAIAAQGKTFEEVEMTLTRALEDLANYYDKNHLKPNPGKTQVCAFHLRNREANRALNITWRGEQLSHCNTPKYLGVKFDRSLTFKAHCEEVKLKVSARNNIIRKLTATSWGARPTVLRTSALALCFSAAEYSAPVWQNSAHTKHIDTALNETGRIVTGCLRPTPVSKLYQTMGIAPPNIRRKVAAEVEKKKQETDPRHPLFGHEPQHPRLQSRKSFLQTTTSIPSSPDTRRVELWRDSLPEEHRENVKEQLPAGSHLPYVTWKTLNRLRAGVSRCKANLKKWGYSSEDGKCQCGDLQDQQHLLVCRNLPNICTANDLTAANETAIKTAEYWTLYKI